MKNYDVVKQIITGRDTYYLANNAYEGHKKTYNSVYLICVPYEIIDRDWDELKVKEYEDIARIEIDTNITLSEEYAPFQAGIKLDSFNFVFPIKIKIREFLKAALNMPASQDIWKYKELLDSITKTEEK